MGKTKIKFDHQLQVFFYLKGKKIIFIILKLMKRSKNSWPTLLNLLNWEVKT
jgi:hypothetical protein